MPRYHPGSVRNAVSVGVLPFSLCRNLVETRQWPVRMVEYHGGETERMALTSTARRSWQMAKRLLPAALVTLREFLEAHPVDAFYIYVMKETNPTFHWDATGRRDGGQVSGARGGRLEPDVVPRAHRDDRRVYRGRMSDTIGRITVPSTTASQVFPLVTDFPHGRAQKRLVITHTLGSGNAKIEQRFYVGSPATRYTFRSARLNATLRLALRNFWEARQGAAGAFFYDVPNEDGSTFTRKTVCFENQALTFEDLSDSICGAGVVFVEIPDPAAAPVYALGATVSRFPNDTLADALLDQVQEIIPLVRIRVLDADVPDILLSDRRVTIRDSRGGGAPIDYLYLPGCCA